MILRVVAATVAALGALAVRGVAPSPSNRAPLGLNIDRATIERAIEIGRSREPDAIRAFHDTYTIRIAEPPFDHLEIITEFRRVVTATELHRNDVSWGATQAAQLLRPFRGTVTLLLDVRFSPLNTYYAMPAFRTVLYARPPARVTPIEPRDVVQVPEYVRGQLAPPGSPVLGGRVEATFDGSALDPQAIYVAGILEEGRERRRLEIDLSRFR